MKYGIDISSWEGSNSNNFKKVRASGIDFMIPRDGWGTDEEDPWYVTFVQQAKEAGMEVPGVFHFVYGWTVRAAIANARKAIELVKKAGLPQTTVIWCDIEYDTVNDAADHGVTLTNQMIRDMACAFCNYCLAEGYPTGIYTNLDYFYYKYGKNICKEYDIWLACYTNTCPYPCVIWQTGSDGKVDGIHDLVDMDTYMGQYTAGTAKAKGDDEHVKFYTEKRLTETLKKLGSGKPPSSYSNKPPKNLLYWDGQRWWADCVNLYKALFNGREIDNPTVGSYQANLRFTGDVDGAGMMAQCTDVSKDFSKLGKHFRCLYMEGEDWHFGGYMGYEWEEPGQGIVNTVESTPRWEDGIQYSYVDEHGNRSWAKGKTVDGGKWTEHGLATKWIDYEDEPVEHKDVTTGVFTGFMPAIRKGDTGDVVEVLQKCLKYAGYYEGDIDSSAGPLTDAAIRAYQNDNGLKVDGIVGKKMWKTLVR